MSTYKRRAVDRIQLFLTEEEFDNHVSLSVLDERLREYLDSTLTYYRLVQCQQTQAFVRMESLKNIPAKDLGRVTTPVTWGYEYLLIFEEH